MRVAQVIYRYLPMMGGAEAYVHALRGAFAAVAEGQTVYQADLGATGEGVVTVPVPRRTGLKLVDFNLALEPRLREILAHDVVIVHNPEHLTRGLAGPRTVLLSHGATWTHEANGLRRWLRRRAMRQAFHRAGAVVANDTFVLRAMGLDIAPGTRMREEVAPGVWFVPNAVDTDVFRPAAAGEPAAADLLPAGTGGPFVFVPRNLTPPRGVDLAIAAFARLRALPPDAQLVIAGDVIRDVPASVAYRAGLDALVRSSGLAGRVHFLGGAAREAMPRLFRAAALTVVPTRCSEGTSLAALESMASATATVTTAVEGLLDLPGPHAAPDFEALGEAMEAAWADRAALGARQRAAVERDFALPEWRDAWRGIVATVAARGRR
jgi:glycosyltransferase involved in cell wall biosynthesis